MTRASLWAAAMVALYEEIADISFPTPQPEVGLGGFTVGQGDPAEYVLVTTTAPIEDLQDWASLGCDRRDEQFTITIEVRSYRPQETARLALTRLEELTGAVEDRIRRTSGAVVDGVRTTQPALIADRLKWWHPISVDPYIGPHPDLEGWASACAITVGVTARI